MTLVLVRVDLHNQDRRSIGYASNLREADKALAKLAKKEAMAVGDGGRVERQAAGYRVVVDTPPHHLSLYTFDDPS